MNFIGSVCAILAALLLSSTVLAEAAVNPANAPTADDKALIEKFDSSLEAIRKTPGRESANFVTDPQSWLHRSYLVMKGEKPGDASKARDSVAGRLREALLGLDWPLPKAVDVPKAKSKLAIDGKLDDADWTRAVVLEGMYLLNTKDDAKDLKNKWRLLWDADFLYVSMEAANSDVIATKEPRDAPLYKNDCAEIFILPDLQSGLYWELLLNPAGSIFDAQHQKYQDRWGDEPNGPAKTMDGLQFAFDVIKDGDKATGYVIEAAIPLSQLTGFDPAKSRSLYMMLVRADRKGKDVNYYAYHPLLSWAHNIWNFGKFNLAE